MIKFARPLRRKLPFAALIALAAANASSAPDPALLIRTLARDPPATIVFAEARFSALLDGPVIVSGQLGFLGSGSFDRVVSAPYAERTEIRGGSVRVVRDGERPRTFALRRAPELGGLLTSLLGLLSGDAAAVADEFNVVAHGTDSVWALELVPLDGGERNRITQILVSGRRSDLHCLAVLSADGGASVMLLGANAADAIAAHSTLATLLPECRAE